MRWRLGALVLAVCAAAVLLRGLDDRDPPPTPDVCACAERVDPSSVPSVATSTIWATLLRAFPATLMPRDPRLALAPIAAEGEPSAACLCPPERVLLDPALDARAAEQTDVVAFVLAHELGHIFALAVLPSEPPSIQQEARADSFALRLMATAGLALRRERVDELRELMLRHRRGRAATAEANARLEALRHEAVAAFTLARTTELAELLAFAGAVDEARFWLTAVAEGPDQLFFENDARRAALALVLAARVMASPPCVPVLAQGPRSFLVEDPFSSKASATAWLADAGAWMSRVEARGGDIATVSTARACREYLTSKLTPGASDAHARALAALDQLDTRALRPNVRDYVRCLRALISGSPSACDVAPVQPTLGGPRSCRIALPPAEVPQLDSPIETTLPDAHLALSRSAALDAVVTTAGRRAWVVERVMPRGCAIQGCSVESRRAVRWNGEEVWALRCPDSGWSHVFWIVGPATSRVQALRLE